MQARRRCSYTIVLHRIQSQLIIRHDGPKWFAQHSISVLFSSCLSHVCWTVLPCRIHVCRYGIARLLRLSIGNLRLKIPTEDLPSCRRLVTLCQVSNLRKMFAMICPYTSWVMAYKSAWNFADVGNFRCSQQ